MSNGGVTNLTVIFVNNSSLTTTACIYQQDPTLGVADAVSVAWLTYPAASTTSVTFEWQVTYDFVWDQGGVDALVAGMVIGAQQTWPANLTTTNQVTLTAPAGGAVTFEHQQAGPTLGTLTIEQDNTIPANVIQVGIGMNESPSFMAPSGPNLVYNFCPSPQYWVTFGNITQGEVLEPSAMGDATQQIVFPDNVYSMTATLGANNLFTITPTASIDLPPLPRAR